MAIIPFPSNVEFRDYKLGLSRSGLALRSRYTGRRQAVVFPYAVWQFEGTIADLDPSEAAAIRAFLTQLKGRENTFRLPLPGVTAPLTGVATDTLVSVNGGGQTGNALVVSCNKLNTALLSVGDYFSVNDEFKMVTENVATNGSGAATINFEPTLRTSPAHSAPVTIFNPTILLAAKEDDIAMWDVSSPFWHEFKLMAEEAF